jgi:hypothetical protein
LHFTTGGKKPRRQPHVLAWMPNGMAMMAAPTPNSPTNTRSPGLILEPPTTHDATPESNKTQPTHEGINIVAIHQHMADEQPRILFLHYWGKGSASALAHSLKVVLDAQALVAP